MNVVFKHPFRAFTIFTFLFFWVLFLITGILVFSNTPQIFQIIMKNICAWSSTFVLLIFFKRLKPDENFKSFFRKQFPKVNISDFIVPFLVQVIIAALAIIIVFILNNESLGKIRFIPLSGIFSLVLINITSGPMGEELGWRGFALSELWKKYNLLVSSIIIGTVWGIWHFPLWIVSGYTGFDLIFYSLSFMIGIVSFSIFISFFYAKKNNILIAVWLHFVFNILMQIVILEDLKFIFSVSLLYLMVSLILVLLKKKIFFQIVPIKE